jgi:hypothetical protein
VVGNYRNRPVDYFGKGDDLSGGADSVEPNTPMLGGGTVPPDGVRRSSLTGNGWSFDVHPLFFPSTDNTEFVCPASSCRMYGIRDSIVSVGYCFCIGIKTVDPRSNEDFKTQVG